MEAQRLTLPTGLTLSVIIPARNEQENLPRCLASLLFQSEPGFALDVEWEILIVDDDSTDRTGAIAAEAAETHPGVRVIAPPRLDAQTAESSPKSLARRNRSLTGHPMGNFTGKTNACWAGAQSARGHWLLFTDADTVHEPGNLARALHEAEKYKAALLSYSPRQVVRGFAQTLLMPLVFAELAGVYPTRQVNDPASRLAAANGQFLLVHSDAYFAVGGHRAVGPSVLEDVALARNIKRSDRLLRFRYAPDALSTHMYRSTGEMMEGWTKNLALLLPSPLLLAGVRALEFLLMIALPLLAAVPSFAGVPLLDILPTLGGWQRAAIFIVWLRVLWRIYGRTARSNFRPAAVAVAPLGLPLLVYLLIRSYVQVRLRKSVTWKGRSYTPDGT